MLDVNLAAYQDLAEDYRETSPERLRHAAHWLQDPEGNMPVRPVAGGRALDIGCADGSHAYLLASRGYEVTGVDFSSRMIDLARNRTVSHGGSSRPRFLEGEFLTGKFVDTDGDVVGLDGQFELVVANAFVHLFPEPDDKEVVRRALDLVAPGGLAFFSTTIENRRVENFFAKPRLDGAAVERWRGHYPKDDFLSLVRGAAGHRFVVTDLLSDDMRGKPWLTVVARRPVPGAGSDAAALKS